MVIRKVFTSSEGIRIDARHPHKSPVLYSEVLSAVAFQPTFGIFMVPHKKEAAGSLRLTRDKPPTVAEIVLHAVSKSRLGVVRDRSVVNGSAWSRLPRTNLTRACFFCDFPPCMKAVLSAR